MTMHLQQLKGMQSSKQVMWKGHQLSIEGIRKVYLFREKQCIKTVYKKKKRKKKKKREKKEKQRKKEKKKEKKRKTVYKTLYKIWRVPPWVWRPC